MKENTFFGFFENNLAIFHETDIMSVKAVVLMKKPYRSMTEGPLFPHIISFTVPLILTSVLNLLFHAADLVVVGQYSGSLSIAAVSSTGTLSSLIVCLFSGFSTGAVVSMAHALGSKDDNAIHRVVHTAMPTAFCIGLLLTAVGLFLAEPTLRLMETPENILPLSSLYMRIVFCGMALDMVYNFAASILRATGDTKRPLYYLMMAGTTNVVLNLFFVAVLELDVAGVALATTLSKLVSTVPAVISLTRRDDACRLCFKKMRIYKDEFLKIVRFGLPASIQSSLFSFSDVLFQSSINSFGEVLISSNAAAGSIQGFVRVSMNAFSTTCVNFVGQNTGGHRYDRVKKVLLICLSCAAALGIPISLIACGFAPQLLSIYITDSPEALALGVMQMNMLCRLCTISSLNSITTGALQGLGESKTSVIISILGMVVVRLGWIYTIFQLPQFHTPFWLFISYPISWVVTLAGQLIAFRILFRKHVNAYNLQTLKT